MGSVPHRVTRGTVALVCGLTIAGVPFGKSCALAAIAPRTFKQYLPHGWAKPMVRRSPFFGAKLAAMRAAWEDPSIPTAVIRMRFHISNGQLQHLVVRGGWPRRPIGRRPKDTRSAEMMRGHL